MYKYNRMSTPLPVVNYARLSRIEAPETPKFQMNLNNICIIVICLSALGLYKRYKDISHKREQLNALTL
jgi:hypothetical protein